MRARSDRLYRLLTGLSAALCAAILLLLAGWLNAAALPALQRPSALLSRVWEPLGGHFGILPMLLSSLFTAAGAVLLASPAALGASLLFARFCHPIAAEMFFTVNRVLSGLPSVLYGLIGMTCLVPLIDRRLTHGTAAGGGAGGLAAVLVLALMLLPVLVAGYGEMLRAVPRELLEASAALGATGPQTAFCCLLPAVGRIRRIHSANAFRRALGEATAVLLVSGNVVRMPSLFSPMRTLAGTVVLEMGYAGGAHRSALFAIGLVLLAVTLTLPGGQVTK